MAGVVTGLDWAAALARAKALAPAADMRPVIDMLEAIEAGSLAAIKRMRDEQA